MPRKGVGDMKCVNCEYAEREREEGVDVTRYGVQGGLCSSCLITQEEDMAKHRSISESRTDESGCTPAEWNKGFHWNQTIDFFEQEALRIRK